MYSYIIFIILISSVFCDDCAKPLDVLCSCHNETEGIGMVCKPRNQSHLDMINSHLPKNIVDLHVLDFNENITIKEYQFNSTSLKALSFYNGKFQGFSVHSLKGLPNLLTLELKNNPGLISLPKDFLADLPNLMNLEISGSNLNEISKAAMKQGNKLKKLVLQNINLQTLIPGMFSDCSSLESLDISHNNIDSMKYSMFKGLVNLQSLNLSQNINVTWYASPFKELVNLKELKMDSMFRNQTQIPPNLFNGLNNLQGLEMCRNGFTDIPTLHYLPLAGTLKKLILDINPLGTIKSNAFDGLSNLVVLAISRSHIHNISADAFKGLKSLKVLSLSENALTYLQNNSFEHLTSLESLDLHDCQIKYIHPNALRGLDNLISLRITKNQLETLSVEVVASAPKAGWEIFGGTPDDNPINCNCSMLSLLRYLQNEARYMNIICYKPTEFYSKYLTDLSEDDFDCSDPNIEGCCKKTISAIVDQDLSIQCKPSGFPVPDITFKVISGQPFPVNRTTFVSNGTVVIISKIQSDDARTVQCEAKNILGSKTMTFDIVLSSVQPYGSLHWFTIAGAIVIVSFLVAAIVLGTWLYRKRRELSIMYEREYLEEGSVNSPLIDT